MSANHKLEQLIKDLTARPRKYQISVADALWLCNSVQPILLRDPSLIYVKGNVNVCGDLHGQLDDLCIALDTMGMPSQVTWVFLGDYVDRGPNSVEVICLLFSLKLRYPNNVILLRGNHESAILSEIFGLAEECVHKLNKSVWAAFCNAFQALPIAAIVNNRFFCVHGGLSPDLESLNQITAIKRPCEIPMEGLLNDLLWSDPDPHIKAFGPNPRGCTICWGLMIAQAFLRKTGLRTIIRAHQMVPEGFDYPFLPDKSVVTMFTASSYSPEIDNKAAIFIIRENGNYDIKQLGSPKRRLSASPSVQKITKASSTISAGGMPPPLPARPRKKISTMVRSPLGQSRRSSLS